MSLFSDFLLWTGIVLAFQVVRPGGFKRLQWHSGLLSYLISVMTVLAGWFYAFGVEYGERVYDSPHYGPIFDKLLPMWYDNTVELGIPNLILAVGALGSLARSRSIFAFQFCLYYLLCVDWGYLTTRLPWDYAKQVGVFDGTDSVPALAFIPVTELIPMLVLNVWCVSLLLTVLLVWRYVRKRFQRNLTHGQVSP